LNAKDSEKHTSNMNINGKGPLGLAPPHLRNAPSIFGQQRPETCFRCPEKQGWFAFHFHYFINSACYCPNGGAVSKWGGANSSGCGKAT
jgi:hypothetical protein